MFLVISIRKPLALLTFFSVCLYFRLLPALHPTVAHFSFSVKSQRISQHILYPHSHCGERKGGLCNERWKSKKVEKQKALFENSPHIPYCHCEK